MSRQSLEVVALPWNADAGFLAWFKTAWEPGQHLAVIAPTGAGKTTFVGGLLGQRRYVLCLDPKGGDDTLEALNFPRLDAWPGVKKMAEMVARNDEDGEVSRFIAGPRVSLTEDRPKLTGITKQTLDGAFDMGGWTIYADELQILTDPRMMNLRSEVDNILISARNKKVSFVSSYQAPSWVTPHAAKMATWACVSYSRDTDVQNRLAEVLGRPKAEIRGIMDGLDEYAWVVIGRNPREPVRVTIPDYIAPRAEPES